MENASLAQARTAPAARSRVWLLLGLSLGYFLVLLDTTIVSVALPALRDDLGGGLSGLQWVANAYTIVFAGLLLTGGGLADRLGAKRVFMSGLILFLAASALSAAAPTLGALIGLRALLGVGGAALVPSSMALIAHAYADPAQRTRALGVCASISGIALAAGPVVGGILVDTLGWRSIFLINVPIGLFSLAATAFLVTETRRKQRQGFDLGGQITAIAAIGCLSYALVEGGSAGWSSVPVVIAFCAAALSIAGFLLAEAKSRSPLLPLSLFRIPTLSAGMAAGMLANIALSGILFLLPLFFQQTRGLSAHASGLALLPLTLPMTINPIFTGRLASRIGPRIPLTAGFVLAAAGTLIEAAVGPATPYAVTLIALLLIGCGMSLVLPPLMASVISSVPREQSGTASGALNSSRQLGAALGVAILGAIVSGGSFIGGLHLALAVAGILLFCGSAVSFAWIGRKRRSS
ncbi:DHA2 family efflux MFS transporter permease subunit [Cohnella zeiphila]|uniref:DHA2 family efflux MFS transporter permease subunit n=1 Tax=Cohnella zeiphila TaxID=2761120 RepID=A0A7X0SHM7_9BACL|nr:DHA2 family efflux MFS transporter permease subunit [Cohnella zeiphila]MBB6730138.1 DHA2 family efflux MFS transporter permease subunit [Cohnella zeiphila]